MIESLCSHFNQNQKSRHLSIEYCDCLLAHDDIFTKSMTDYCNESPKEYRFSQRDQLKQIKMDERLIASASVLLASKFCEIDDNLIMIKEIQEFMKNYYNQQYKDIEKKQGQKTSPLTRFNYLKYEDIARAEIHVLERFEWDMFRIIPLDFCEIYILMLKKIKGTTHSMVNVIKKQEDIICEQIMVDHQKYIEYMPSDIALAILVTSFLQYINSDECLISKQECEYIIKQVFTHIYNLTEKSKKQYFLSNSICLKSNILNEQYPQQEKTILNLIKQISGKEIEIDKLYIQKKDKILKNINLIESNKKGIQNSSFINTPNKIMNLESSQKRSIKHNEFSNTITANKEFQPIKYSGAHPQIRLYAQSSTKKQQQNQSCQSSVQKNYLVKSPLDSQNSFQKFSIKNQKISQNLGQNNLQRKLDEINKIASSNNILKLAAQNIYEQLEHESQRNHQSLNSYSLYLNKRKYTTLQQNNDNVYMNIINPKSSEKIKEEYENQLQLNVFKDMDYYKKVQNPVLDLKKSIKTSDQFSDLQELSPLSDKAKEYNSNYNKLNKINKDCENDILSGTRLTTEFSKKCQLQNQYYKKQNENEKFQSLNYQNHKQFDENNQNKPIYYKVQNDQAFDCQHQYNQFILKKNRSQTTEAKTKSMFQDQQAAQIQEIDYDQLQKQLTEEIIQYETKKKSLDSISIKNEKNSTNIKNENDKNDNNLQNDNQNNLQTKKNVLSEFLKRKSEHMKIQTSQNPQNAFQLNYFLKNQSQEDQKLNLQEKNKEDQDKIIYKKISIASYKQIQNQKQKESEIKLDVQLHHRIELLRNISKISSRKSSANPQKASSSIIKIDMQHQIKQGSIMKINKYMNQQIREQKNQSIISSKRSQSQLDNLNLMSNNNQLQGKISPQNLQIQKRFGQQFQRIQSDSQFQYFSVKANNSQKVDFSKKAEFVKPIDKNINSKIADQIAQGNKKEQLTSRSSLKKLTSPVNQIQELKKHGIDLMKQTPREQIKISRNQNYINERVQNSITKNSLSRISQNSKQLLNLKQIQDNRLPQQNEDGKLQNLKTIENIESKLNANEECDFSCSPLKNNRRNLSSLFQSSSSSQHQNQLSARNDKNNQSKLSLKVEKVQKKELQDEEKAFNKNHIGQQNPENNQQQNLKNNNEQNNELKSRGSITALKNNQIKNESRYPSTLGENRIQNQEKNTFQEQRVKSQLQYNTTSLKSPKESIDIFSQKLISILNEGKISAISDSIKEEEELNASLVSQRDQRLKQPRNISIGLSSVIQRLSSVKEESDKPQTKKSHYLNILRDHIQKQQTNKKYQNKFEKQELSNDKSLNQQNNIDSSLKKSSGIQNSIQGCKKQINIEKTIDNSDLQQKIQYKQASIIDELKQNKFASKQESFKTLQKENSYSQLKQTLDKQRYSSNQKKNLSIICEESKTKLQKNDDLNSFNQTQTNKIHLHLEKIDEQQKVIQKNYQNRQAIITPKQSGANITSKQNQNYNQQLSGKNKQVQRKYNLQVHYLQSNKVLQKIFGNKPQDSNKEDNKQTNQSNMNQKKQIFKDETIDQKERQKTPLQNEIDSLTQRLVKKSEQSSIMSQISNTSQTNKIIKPSLKYNNPFKNQSSVNHHKKQQYLHVTNQQQGESVNFEQNYTKIDIQDSLDNPDVEISKVNNKNQNDSKYLLQNRFDELEHSKLTYKNQTSRILNKNVLNNSNRNNIKINRLKESHSHQQIEDLYKNTVVQSDLTEINQILNQEITEKKDVQNSKRKELENKSNLYMKKSNSISNYEFQSYFLNKQRRSIEIIIDKKLIKNKMDNSKQQESSQSIRKMNRNSIQTDNQKQGSLKKLNEYKVDLQKFHIAKKKQLETSNDKSKIPKAYLKRNQSNSRPQNSKQFNYSQKLINELSNINQELSFNNLQKDFKTLENKKAVESKSFIKQQNQGSLKMLMLDSQQDKTLHHEDDNSNNQMKQQDFINIKDEEDQEKIEQDLKNLKKRRSALERKINKTYKIYDK